jgi:hypothetical protein
VEAGVIARLVVKPHSFPASVRRCNRRGSPPDSELRSDQIDAAPRRSVRLGARGGAIDGAEADALPGSFPDEDFWVIEDDDGEKSYSYAARPLVTLGAERVTRLAPLPPAWERLGADLLSPAYRDSLGELIGRPLDDALMEASIWRLDANAQAGPHRDMASKIVTQVFYLSSEWEPEWGGCLRILRSRAPEDLVAELPPLNGTASVLVPPSAPGTPSRLSAVPQDSRAGA